MNKVVAVEANLTPVKEFLTSKGYQVVDVKAAQQNQVAAVVLSGGNQNLMGMQDVMVNAPVIDARGKTPEEVWSILSR